MQLTDRQTSTILAALRFYQRQPRPTLPEEIKSIATDDHSLTSLDSDEIDALCEALNTTDPNITGGITIAHPFSPSPWIPIAEFKANDGQDYYFVATENGETGEAYQEDGAWWWSGDPSGPIESGITHVSIRPPHPSFHA